MNKHKWTEDELNYFLHLYKNRECLWNVKKSSYSNKTMRETAFAAIKTKMLQNKNIDGLGVAEIKDKIYNLRATYYQLRKKFKYSSFCPSQRVGKWYKDMDYIVQRSKSNDKNKLDTKEVTSTKEEARALATDADNFQLDDKQDNEKLLHEKLTQISTTSTNTKLAKLESRIEIMNVLRKLYMEKVAPNYVIMFDILTKILKNYLTKDVVCFETEMIKLGYIYKENIDGTKMIVENAEQRFERFLYLTKIKKLRGKKNKQIIYIDERVISTELNYEKIDSMKDGLPPESSVLFLAITSDGYFHGLFSNQATNKEFNKWVTDILLGLTKTPSVIVMDNSPIHGKLEDSCPITRYSTKMEMFKWLTDNNIPCSPNVSRPELYELIRRHKRDIKEYRIDRIIRSHGHEVLRLPNNFSDLNLNDVMWNAIADGYCARFLKSSMAQSSLQMLQNKIIDNILPSISKKKWSELEKVLIMRENEIYQIDTAIENILETNMFT